ncbi:MAG: hypothetical protein V1906_03570 [Candidatus Woesearchaeota archaeon]
MDRKSYIENFVVEMEEKYNPSERMKYAIRRHLVGLLDISIPEDTFYSLVTLAEETYQRSSEIKESCAAARKSLDDISSDLTETASKLGEAVGKYCNLTASVVQNYVTMIDTLNSAGKIIVAQEQTIKQLVEDKGKLEDKILENHLKENPPKAKA